MPNPYQKISVFYHPESLTKKSQGRAEAGDKMMIIKKGQFIE